MKRLFVIMGKTVLTVGIILAVVPYSRDAIANSWRLHHFRGSLTSLPHLPGTSRVCVFSEVALFRGNSNHCDYFIAEIRTYSGPKSAIKSHYAPLRIDNPITKKKEKVDIIFFAGGRVLDPEVWWWPLYGFEDISAWNIPAGSENLSMYALAVFNMYDANWDIRCH